jgi:transcription antitermination factor NusG
MESTAFLSRPKRQLFNSGSAEPALHVAPFLAGQQVRIVAGPLTGMKGSLVKQATDGRWVVQLADVSAGVLLCIDERNFDRR